ncbi:SsgA family sporulation/cell division regulator [Amycolatopsis panacis]|uniref:SsgA family sporulation/cell division regulator n=1 Tax=Amycolatopsis panacis TaxID=2340917 RepID=A0A419IBS0_9PSEU|nr:SsgA family sporulation/cell division regulator [Amycolatopsis panacis]RJQ92376.1 SsgA family sporulation/cell division regulator [Amycolatopsis panacis]
MDAFTMPLPALLETGHTTLAASYRADDPWAITIGFDAVQPGLKWTLSRELVADALVYGQAGVGDLNVTARGDLVILGLSTPDGSAAVVLRRDEVADLLHRTFELVRPGTEPACLDWSDITDFPGVTL